MLLSRNRQRTPAVRLGRLLLRKLKKNKKTIKKKKKKQEEDRSFAGAEFPIAPHPITVIDIQIVF